MVLRLRRFVACQGPASSPDVALALEDAMALLTGYTTSNNLRPSKRFDRCRLSLTCLRALLPATCS